MILKKRVACQAALKGLRYGSRHARRHKDQTPGSAGDTVQQVVVLYGSKYLLDASIGRVFLVYQLSHVGVASTMFRVLSEEGINIQMISTSEIKTSVVIDEKYLELAVRALHTAFDLDKPAE